MKKFIAAILALCIVAGVTIISYAESIYGDVTKDGKVNSSDALMILRYSVGIEKSIDTKLADINHDGKINSTDALLALQISIGKTPAETVKTTTATPKKLTDIPKSLGTVKKQWNSSNASGLKATGLNIQIGRVELAKSVTQTFDKTINSQITSGKSITYKPVCSVAIIDCDTPTRLNISKGTAKDNTENIAKNVGAVIAVNGRSGYPTNVATIRSGAVYKKYEGTEGKAGMLLVMYKDGTWKYVKNLDNTTAAAEIKKGAYNTCGFQDVTIQDGKITTTFKDVPYRNRTFLGKVSATRYILMTTEFMPIKDAAQVLLSYGVTDAIQINGGNCSQMYVKGIGNTTNSVGGKIKPLNKVGMLETEWFYSQGLIAGCGGPCNHEMDVVYFK